MKTWNLMLMIAAMALVTSGARAGTFDRGLIAKDTPSNDTSAGQQYSGSVSVEFDGFAPVDGTAGAFEAVLGLRKGGARHAFLYDYDCSVADPCGLCVVGGRLDTTDQVGIQLCIEDGVEPRVISEFGLASGVAVRLKDVTNPIGELEAADRLVFVGDVTVSAK